MFLYLCKMKRVFSYGLLSLVAVMYMAATVGFGVHVCKDDGATEAMLLMGKTCCQHSHAHTHDACQIHEHGHTSADHVGSEACTASEGMHCCAQGDGCEVSVYVLGADQDVVSKVSLSMPFMAYLADLPDEMACPSSGPRTEPIYWSDPPPLITSAAFLLPLRL